MHRKLCTRCLSFVIQQQCHSEIESCCTCRECLSDAACSGSKICDPITYSCKDPAVVYLSGSDPKSQITAIYGCTRDLSTCDKQFELSGTSAAFFSSNGDTVLINSNIENQIIGARKDGLQLVDIKNNTVNVELGFGGFASPEVAFFPQYPPFLSNGKIYACDVSGQTVSNCQDSGFMPPSITNSRGTSSIFLVSVNLYGGYAFIVAFYGSSSKIISCKVSGKNLTDCKLTGPTVDGFFNNIAFSGYEGGAFAFFGGSGGQTGNLTRCTVQSEGTLGACEDGGSVGKLPIIISILESTVYATIAESNDPVLRVCQITGGKVGDCTDKTPLPPGEIPLTVLAVL